MSKRDKCRYCLHGVICELVDPKEIAACEHSAVCFNTSREAERRRKRMNRR